MGGGAYFGVGVGGAELGTRVIYRVNASMTLRQFLINFVINYSLSLWDDAAKIWLEFSRHLIGGAYTNIVKYGTMETACKLKLMLAKTSGVSERDLTVGLRYFTIMKQDSFQSLAHQCSILLNGVFHIFVKYMLLLLLV